jgi:hypothetical protein
MFTLKKQIANLAHLNLRDEKHGEDTKLAADLKIKADVPNSFLDEIAPGLLASLYTTDDEQGALLDDGHLPVLRYPMLEPLKCAVTPITGALVILGGEDEDDMDFDVTIKKIELDCHAGGTVAITFSAATLPDATQVGKLSAMLGGPITVSLFGGEISKATAED